MVFGVADVPRIGKYYARCFTVRPLAELKERAQKGIIPLGQRHAGSNQALNQVATRLGVTEEKLIAMGVTEQGIDLAMLEAQLPEALLTKKNFLRKGEKQTPENIIRMIVGMCGEGAGIFEPINIYNLLSDKKKVQKTAELAPILAAYLKKSDCPELSVFSYGQMTMRLTNLLYNTREEKEAFVIEVARSLALIDIADQVDFIRSITCATHGLFARFEDTATKTEPEEMEDFLRFICEVIPKLNDEPTPVLFGQWVAEFLAPYRYQHLVTKFAQTIIRWKYTGDTVATGQFLGALKKKTDSDLVGFILKAMFWFGWTYPQKAEIIIAAAELQGFEPTRLIDQISMKGTPVFIS